MDSKELGKIIATRRKELKLTQQDLADKVGSSQQTIQRIESGSVERSRLAPDIAKVLGLDPEIFTKSGGMARAVQLESMVIKSTSTIDADIPIYDAANLVAITNGEDCPADAHISRPDWFDMDVPVVGVLMPDSSMEPEIREGAVVLIDQGAAPAPGQVAIVVEAEAGIATISRFTATGNKKLLIPDNQRFPGVNLDESATIIGTALCSINPLSHKIIG